MAKRVSSKTDSLNQVRFTQEEFQSLVEVAQALYDEGELAEAASLLELALKGHHRLCQC